jgi:hypothetical protein
VTATTYEIQLEGVPRGDVLSAYEGVNLTVDPDGVTLCARIPDQAALHGILVHARLLGLEVVRIAVLEPRHDSVDDVDAPASADLPIGDPASEPVEPA